MRVKKLLPLILLTVGALFLLSSCDAILNALYANNTINVTLTVSTGDVGVFSPKSYVNVVISGATGGTQTSYYSYTSVYNYYDTLSFSRLPNGNYTVTAYYFGYGLGTWDEYPPPVLIAINALQWVYLRGRDIQFLILLAASQDAPLLWGAFLARCTPACPKKATVRGVAIGIPFVL
jgi:hypothetical protein